ncbi:MAG: putative lipid II flippase FtsW, partial [Candidatus Gastranaerophilales bacterium]|nr:putative lipid II flippase FtsW [Candidatus Gastranaerophilales bacterium]
MASINKHSRLARFQRRSQRKKRILLGPPDGFLILIIFALLVLGILAVFSASAPEGLDQYGNSAYFLIRQLISIAIGLVLFVIAYKTDYRIWRKYIIPFSILTIVLLAATFLPGIGRTAHGSSRWLTWLPVQPSELCKFATVILVSSALVESKKLFDTKMVQNLVIIAIMMICLLCQPNLSITILLGMITLALLLIGGVSFRFLTFTSLGAAVIALIGFVRPYQLARIKGWLDPWAEPHGIGYNLIQSYYAIGSGGFFGVGYGNSRQKLFWLPFCHTDFIFAVIAEELGLIGGLVIIALFLALLHRGFVIANKCPELLGKFIAFGITFAIVMQAFVNIAVTTGVFPVTGVTLPLISYGGSSVVITLFMLGILLNISRKRIKNTEIEEEL